MKSKYNSFNEFRKAEPSASSIARSTGLVPKICEKFGWTLAIKWTLETCLKDALQYNTIQEWAKINTSIQWARRNKVMDICTAHMVKNNKNNWQIKENVLVEAKKHNNIKNWQLSSSASYQSAKKNDWFEEAIVHMTRLIKPSGYWTKERCIEEALKYETKEEWKHGDSSSYTAAVRNGWYEECSGHMIQTRKPPNYWTKERCIEEALKYDTVSNFEKNAQGAFTKARKNGWLDECTNHMKNGRLNRIKNEK